MRIYSNENIENIAHKIYVFSTVNTVYTFKLEDGAVIWKSVLKKQSSKRNQVRIGGMRIFRYGILDNKFVIWRKQ